VVYFAQHLVLSVLKIGYTRDIYSRIPGLRAVYGDAVRILRVMPGTRPEEKSIQNHFASFQAWGEWYWPVEPIVHFMNHFTSRWDGSSDIYSNPVDWDNILPRLYPVAPTATISRMKQNSRLQFGFPLRELNFYCLGRDSSPPWNRTTQRVHRRYNGVDRSDRRYSQTSD
jgi:hypothetical protein